MIGEKLGCSQKHLLQWAAQGASGCTEDLAFFLGGLALLRLQQDKLISGQAMDCCCPLRPSNGEGLLPLRLCSFRDFFRKSADAVPLGGIIEKEQLPIFQDKRRLSQAGEYSF